MSHTTLHRLKTLLSGIFYIPPLPNDFSTPAISLSVAIALPDSEPPNTCVYTKHDRVSEERYVDVDESNTAWDHRWVESVYVSEYCVLTNSLVEMPSKLLLLKN